MASATDTLAGILLLGDANNADIDVSDLLDDAPLIRAMAAVTSSQGTSHKYNKRTVAAGVGFRSIGSGLDNSAGSIEQVTVALKLLDATVRRDKGAAKGYRGGESAYMANEARWALRAAFAHAEKQIILGTGNEADGFNGFNDSVFIDDQGDGMVVDAGGSGGNSVYLIRSTPDDVALVTNGEIEVGDLEGVSIYDGSASYPGWQLSILSWLGLQVGNVFGISRIYNLDGTSGNTLTDDLIAEAYAKHPVGSKPTHIVMGREEQRQLQNSRTATTTTGAPAPFPTMWENLPIIVTDALVSNAGGTPATTTTT